MHFRAFPAVKILKIFNYEAPEARGQIAPSVPLSAALPAAKDDFQRALQLIILNQLNPSLAFSPKKTDILKRNESISTPGLMFIVMLRAALN